MNTFINPGETKRFDCEECRTEFEVAYELKLAEMTTDEAQRQSGTFDAKRVKRCPFCGSDKVTTEED